MTGRSDRDVSPTHRRRGRHRRQLRPRSLRGIHQPAPGPRAAAAGHRGSQKPRRHADHSTVGPPGLKQDVAMIIAAELGSSLRVTSVALDAPVTWRRAVQPGRARRVVYRRDPHRPARRGMLYLTMEDFRVDVVVGKVLGHVDSAGGRRFPLVGATTRSSALTGPLRDRFGFTAHMVSTSPPSWAECWPAPRRRFWSIELGADAGAEILF